MKRQIIVGFDAKRIVRNGTGLGSYGRTLVNDLAANSELDLRLYVPDRGRDNLRLQVPERQNLHFVYPLSALSSSLSTTPSPLSSSLSTTPSLLSSLLSPLSSLRKSYWRSRGIVSQLQADGVQVFHGLSGELPAGIRKSGIKTVVTIHDLIFMRHPEYYNPIDVFIYKRKFFQTLREADRIVAISECTRRDICELGGVEKERVDLIYQSCAQRFRPTHDAFASNAVRVRYKLAERFILSVGSIEERKNTLLAVKALAWLPADVHLVLVGRSTKYAQQVADYARNHQLDHRLHLLHGVPDDDLPALYSLAEAFVYPSRYEGFGIPIIEAIRMGLPVVACTGSCLEEAGGPDNIYVDPDDAEGMAAALQQVLQGASGREQRISSSQNYIRRFENSDAAQRFADIYASMTQRL